jgi:hypothetical protein
MAGVKGAGGPPPKRSDQRRRSNLPVAGEPRKAPAGEPFEVPEGDEDWHPIALRWFNSLKTSGQSAFYVESDWLTAFAVAESMSREFKPQVVVVGHGKDATVEMHELPPKAASLTAWLKGAASLLATEGDRRRAGLELERDWVEEGAADVSHFADARARLRGAG